MQGPIYPDMPSEGRKDGFFYRRRWMVPLGTVLLTNMFYVYGVKAMLPEPSMAGLKFIESTHSASYLLFSILPFSESYFAKVQSAYSSSAPALLVVHSHAFILLTSLLLLLLMLIKRKSLIQYIIDAKELARKDVSWSIYSNAILMSLMVLLCLFMVVLSTTLQSVSKPDLILDGALLSAVFTPLLVYWGICAILLAVLGRKAQST